MKSFKGHFLVASSQLLDPNFARTVVLLVHHNEEGAFGVVLNRPADSTIAELWEKVSETPCECDQPLHVGGPVPGPLMALHGDGDLAELEVAPGVYFAAQRDNLEKLLDQDEHPFRLFVGHSGWGAGQLENELAEGAWLTTPASAEYVFCDHAELWQNVVKRVGSAILSDALKLKEIPPDPTLN